MRIPRPSTSPRAFISGLARGGGRMPGFRSPSLMGFRNPFGPGTAAPSFNLPRPLRAVAVAASWPFRLIRWVFTPKWPWQS